MNNSSLHFSVNIISRKDGRSTVACAAYRSDEKLFDERNQRNFQFKKHEVQPESFILAPSHAPDWVNERERLWNEVEKVEKRYNSQLSREVLLAIPNDLNSVQQKQLVEEFVRTQFVEKGMVADVNIHRDKGHNPHAHVMLTMRPFNEDGTWGDKRPFTGELDKNGKKIYKDNPWDHKDNVEVWRNNYQDLVNKTYERLNLERRFDLRSYEKQGKEEIGTIHLGHVASGIEKREKEKAIREGREYRPVTSQGKLNEDIKKANKELNLYEQELSKASNKIIQLEQKKREMEIDIRRSLEKSGLWNVMNPQEKASIMYVRNRMKDDVNLTVALKCQSQFVNWESALNNKENSLRDSLNKLKQSKEIYQEYRNAPDNTIAKERAGLQLQRLGFTASNFENEFKFKQEKYNNDLTQYKAEKGKFIENNSKVNEAVRVLESVTVSQAKVLYNNDQNLSKFPPQEIDKLVQEFKNTGNLIPLKDARDYLNKVDTSKPKSLQQSTILEQYDKFKKDNQFVVNWKRSLDRKETEIEKNKATNPVEYTKVKEDIFQQREALAERLKQVKTSLAVIEKTMIVKVKEQYPNETRLNNLDGKTAAKILRVNEKEKRVVPIDEFMKHIDKNKTNSNERIPLNKDIEANEHLNGNREIIDYEKKQIQSEMMSNIANSIQGFMDDSDKGRKSDIDRVLDENKRKNNGLSR